MKLVPLFDRVVLKKLAAEETTASGIVLPGQGDKDKPGQGEIVAVGPGGLVTRFSTPSTQAAMSRSTAKSTLC